MSLWFREQRGAPAARSVSSLEDLARVVGMGAGYAHVDGSQISSAEQVVAVRSTVDLIASLASELPIDIFSGKGAARREVPMPSYLEDPAGDGYGLQDWIYQLVTSWLYRGNAYADKVATRGQMITQAVLIHPDKVSGTVIGGAPVWSVSGRDVPDERLAHWRVNPTAGCLLGLSPIRAHATTVGTALSSQRYGKSWFDDDAHPTGILRNTRKPLGPGQADTVKRRFMEALRRSSRGREPLVMDGAWEWETLQVNPEDSMLIETMGWSAAECARIFGPGFAEILGYQTGGSNTYANVQDRDITMLKYGMNRWLRRLERVLFQFLPRPQYAVINRDALLQTNTLARYQAHMIALGKPWMAVEEVRELEDLPPREIEEPSAPTPTPPGPGAGDDEETEDEEAQA